MWENRNYRKEFSLHKSLESFFDDLAEYLIHLKVDTRFPCTLCYDESTGEPDRNCKVCFGTGYDVTPQVVPGRLENTLSRLDGDMPTLFGLLEKGQTIFHTRRNVHLRKQDILLHVTWNVDSYEIASRPERQPVEILNTYVVEAIERPYEREVAWNAALVRAEEIRRAEIDLNLLTNIPIIP